MQIMRQRRIERGALTLASPEVKFEIDTETHDPLDVGGFSVLPFTCYGSVFLLTSSPLFSSAIFFFLLLLTMWVVMLCLFCLFPCMCGEGRYVSSPRGQSNGGGVHARCQHFRSWENLETFPSLLLVEVRSVFQTVHSGDKTVSSGFDMR